MLLLEVIVQTVDDARAATEGGADRLEVVRAIREGGLTPSPSLVDEIRQATPLPLRVMVRGKAATTDAGRIRGCSARAGEFAAAVSTVSSPALRKSASWRSRSSRAVIAAAPGVPVTFHRAFDTLTEPSAPSTCLRRFPRSIAS